MGSGRWVVVGGWWLVNGGKSLGGILEGGGLGGRGGLIFILEII